MPRSSAPKADPAEMFPFPVGETPVDDRMYFEMLTWFVFGAGLNWRVMRAKWPNFRKAFANFNIAKVAKVRRSGHRPAAGRCRHRPQWQEVVGTIENAREMLAIVKEHGGMTLWLRGYRADGDALIKDVKSRFHHIGDTTARMFLTCVGAIEYQTWEATARQRAGRSLVAGRPYAHSLIAAMSARRSLALVAGYRVQTGPVRRSAKKPAGSSWKCSIADERR